ncbi:armadillo-type protein [Mycena rebaudengoi]|nr:armadillo-type protein [Mycena rebaudengoi]
MRLVSLLDDESSAVVEQALWALSQAALWLDGAQSMVQAKVQAHVLKFLKSPKPELRQWTCLLVGNLAHHKATTSVILKINPYVTLLSFLGDEDYAVVQPAVRALAQAAFWLGGAQALLQAKVQDHVLKWLESPNQVLRKWACHLVGNIARHRVTVYAMLEISPHVPLVSLLDDEYPDVLEQAIYALAQVTFSLDGARAVVEAKVQDHFLKFLESPRPELRRWVCWLVGSLARHEATAPAILRLNPSPKLVSLLRDTDIFIRGAAIRALTSMSKWPDGVAVLADIGISEILEKLSEAVKTESTDDRVRIRSIQGSLARYKAERARFE